MGKSKPKIPVYAYKMSIQYGICHGVVDFLHRLTVREKVVWAGRKCGPDALLINQPKIFGGLKKEGGVQGFAYFQNGNPTQLLHPHPALKQGGLPSEVPGYRGISTLTFTEADNPVNPADGEPSEFYTLLIKAIWGSKNPGFDGPGFYWVAGSPYLPGIWATVQRVPRPFLTDKAYILREAGEGDASTAQSYCFAISWDEEIGLPGPQPSERPWTVNGDTDYDGDGVTDSRADYTYGMIAAFCEKLVALGEGASTVTLHFVKGAGSRNDTDMEVLGGPTRPDSWNNPAFSDGTHFAKVGPFLASDVDTTTGYVGIDLPRGTNAGSHADNSTAFVGPSGLFDAVIADHDNGNKFDYVFYVGEHAEDDRWDKFETGDPWKYQTNAEMKADYHRIASDWRGRCIKFRMLAYYDFYLGGGSIQADKEDTTWWDVLYMISGGEAHGSEPWYGPYVDILHSDYAWHWWHARYHGFSADLEEMGGGYNVDFTNIYSDEDTAAYETGKSGAFDSGGGAEAWIEYFFSSRIFADYNDANPAHMIVECLTNSVWGMGYPFAAINMAKFSKVAHTLYNERFGLSMMWAKADTIENFVSEVLDHIDAALYINPANGLFEITLIRDDYDELTLPVLDPSNCTVVKSAHRMASEATNEITVSWTNPDNEQDETVTIQDLGGIVAAGGVVKSETRNYYGVRRRDLATTVLARDIRSASAPITTMDVDVTRARWDELPGNVLKMVYPEHQIFASDPMVVRVTAVDYGKPGASKIRLTVAEDVFSLAPHIYDVPPGTALTDESTVPTEADAQQVLTLPYFFAYNVINPGAADAAVYPDVFAGVMVAEADAGSLQFNLLGDTINPAGAAESEDFGVRDCLAHGTLQSALLWEAESSVADWGVLTNGTGPKVGGFVLIGDPSDNETVRELAMVSAFAGGVYTIKRGVLDTVPRAWPVGTETWFVALEDEIADQETRAAAEVVDYTAQIIATGGILPLSEITAIPSYTLTERPHLPSRPANVKVDGIAFGPKFYSIKPVTVPVTWNGRNRLTENAQVLGWTDAGVTVEVGQTVEVEVYDAGLTLIHTFTGLTGGSASLDETEFDQVGITTLRFFSKLGAFRSLQYYETRVDTRGGVGYGMNYGNDYGGT